MGLCCARAAWIILTLESDISLVLTTITCRVAHMGYSSVSCWPSCGLELLLVLLMWHFSLKSFLIFRHLGLVLRKVKTQVLIFIHQFYYIILLYLGTVDRFPYIGCGGLVTEVQPP